MATGADGNPAVWIFNMKNRFGWRDKHEIESRHEGKPVTIQIVEAVKPDDSDSID